MLANIADNQFINLEQVTQGSEEALVKWFSARHPGAHFSKDWDGWTRRYNVAKQRLYLPYLSQLTECCRIHDIPLQIVDHRPAPKFPAPQPDQITETFIENVVLEDYQVRSIRATCENEIGIIKAVTGAGKTEIMCGIVKAFRCPTVIITEQVVVLEQIVERLRLRNVVHGDDIGMFCQGNMPDGNLVIVGSIQSLSTPTRPEKSKVKVTRKRALRECLGWIIGKDGINPRSEAMENLERVFPKALAEALYDNPEGVEKLNGTFYAILEEYIKEISYDMQLKSYKTRDQKAGEIQDFVRRSDLLLVDECDLATNDQYGAMFRNVFKGRRRFGFSGTPFDKKKPVENLKLRGYLGDVIVETERAEVLEAGRIIPIHPHMFGIGPINKEDARMYDVAVREEMVENTAFHNQVAQIVSAFPNDGTMILVDTSPIKPLGVALEKLIPNSKFIFGSSSQKERNNYIESFERRELTCLIGSKILKRGLDLKGGVENLIIIGGGKSWSDFDQKVGRAVRLNKRGWSRVFSFFFLNNKYLYKHSKESLKALLDMGYSVKIHINGVELDGQKFVRSNFAIPKHLRT